MIAHAKSRFMISSSWLIIIRIGPTKRVIFTVFIKLPVNFIYNILFTASR